MPDGAIATGLSASAAGSGEAELTPVAGEPDGQAHIIDESRVIPAGETIISTVTVGYTYSGTGPLGTSHGH